MFIISDRVKETSTTSGSGSISLNGAYGAFQTFLDGIGNGSTTYYTIENNSRWEVGQGTYTASTNSLSRDVVFSSSQGGAKINLQGTSTVFCTLPAEKAFIKDPNSGVSVNDIVSSGQANLSSITTNSIYVSGDSNFSGDTNVNGDHLISGNLLVLGNSDLKNVSGEFLTLVRPNSAGNFFHAYKDDSINQTVSLHVDSNTSPLWRLGLKTSPSSQTSPPTFAYIYGADGSVGSVSNANNYFSIADTLGFSVFHEDNLIFRASSDTGVYINGKSALYPAFTIKGAPLNVEDLQRWENYTGTVLSVIDSGGKVGILTDSPIYDLDVSGSGRLESIYLTSGIYFQDGTFQNTAQDGGITAQDIEAVSGIAVYSSGVAEQNAIDIITVSGLLGDSEVANFASGLAVQNEIDIATVSGLLYDDAAISGYFESRADTNENQIIAVSGWAESYVDSQDHSAASVSGWADSSMDTRDAAVSGWARDYVDSQDHSAAAVSGWAEATFLTQDDDSYVSGVATYASGLATQNVLDIATVSGLLSEPYDDTAISGYFESRVDTNETQIIAVSGWAQNYVDSQDHSAAAVSGWAEATFLTQDDDSYVSGVAVYASGHNLQSITDNGATTNNAITITNNNITASSGLFNTLDMTPLAEASYPAHQEGVVFYDVDNHTLSLYNDEADVTLQLGQEQFLRVRNNTGATITNGTAVLITGSHGNSAPTISGAIATSESLSQVVGVATHDIEDSSFGYVTTYGIVRNVDTSQYSDGDEIFLSATQIGSGVNSSPTIPNYKVTIGHVIRSHDSNGSVLVQIGNSKLGGGDLKSEAELNLSGVPFVTNKSDTTAGGSQTDPLFIFDSGNRQLQLGSGLQLLDGVPTNTTNVLYNNAGTLTFNGSSVGGSSTSGIVFEKSGSNDEFRIGTTFIDADGTQQVVRATDFNGGYLRLEVARFSPSVSAAGQSRSWDQPVSQWTVTVDNPTDFLTNYVSGVAPYLTSIIGSVTSGVDLYSTSGPSSTPAGGVDWNQTFTVDGDSPIYSTTSNLTGGSASATVSFLDKNQDTISDTATISFSWQNASNSISFANLSGKNFLESYPSTTYNLTINGISNLANTSTLITSSQGSLSNTSDDGTITFTNPIHKNNNSGRTITATTDFTRPDTVTGTEYTAQDISSDSSITASFTYPSFYILTSSTGVAPTRADIVDGDDFDSATVTELGNQVKTFEQELTLASAPKAFWFAVRSSASQPTSFQTGASAALLSDTPYTTGVVSLEPDSPAAGYVAEDYTIYGITLASTITYIKIS